MNEPIPVELEELMKVERTAPHPALANRERVLQRLESSVAALAVGATVGASAAAAAGTGGGVVGGVKAIGALLARGFRALVRGKVTTALVAVSVGAAGGAAIAYRVGERVERARHVAVAPPPVSVSDSSVAIMASSALSATSSAEPQSATRAVASSSGASAPSHPHTSAQATAPAQAGTERDAKLAEELALVQTARTALVRGDAPGALDAAEIHRQRFPSGRLVEERESIAIQALVSLGRGDEARRRAADFERKYPTSMLLPAISRALRSIQ